MDFFVSLLALVAYMEQAVPVVAFGRAQKF
jgi:hypothetical protein